MMPGDSRVAHIEIAGNPSLGGWLTYGIGSESNDLPGFVSPGGGIKPGISLGATDDVGFNVVQSPISVHDLHATMLHLMGLDHTRLTYRFQGRDFRLTDVAGEVVKKLLA